MSDSDESRVTHTEIPSRLIGPAITRLHTWPRGATVTTPTRFCPRAVIRLCSGSDPEADPDEDDETLRRIAVDYFSPPANEGSYRRDDQDESSEDDEDDDVDIEADDEEQEDEPSAPADSTAVALPAIDQAPSAEETEPFKTDESVATPPPHPAYRVTAMISIPAPVPTPVWSDAEIPSPPLPQIPSPPLQASSPIPVLSPSPPASLIRSLSYRAAMIRLRAKAASTSHSLPLPPPIILSHTRPDAPSLGTPPLHLLSTNRRDDRPEIRESLSAVAARPARGLWADYGFVATMDREIRHDLERERDVGYGITDYWDEIVEAMYGTLVVIDVSRRQLLASWLNMLFRDRRAHARTARLMETEARMSKEVWGRSMDASDLTRAEVMLLRTIVLAQQSQIREL
ncbi:hypothetical protein Tco_0013398 [Tanacetum coccineum]